MCIVVTYIYARIIQYVREAIRPGMCQSHIPYTRDQGRRDTCSRPTGVVGDMGVDQLWLNKPLDQYGKFDYDRVKPPF